MGSSIGLNNILPASFASVNILANRLAEFTGQSVYYDFFGARVSYYHSFEEASNLAIHGQLSEDSLASLDSKTSSIYQHSLLSAPQYFSRLLNHTLEDIYSELFLQGLIPFL